MQLSAQKACLLLSLFHQTLASPIAFPSKDSLNLIPALSSRSPSPSLSLTARQEDIFQGIQATLDGIFGQLANLKAGNGAGNAADNNANKAADSKVKRQDAAIAALQADVARLQALQAKEGPAAAAGLQKAIDSIQAEIARLQGAGGADAGAGVGAGNNTRRAAFIGEFGALEGGAAAAAAEGIAKGFEGELGDFIRGRDVDQVAKRANQAALDALQADVARLQTLQKGKGAAAQAGIQKGIDSIEAEIQREDGGKKAKRADDAAAQALQADVTRLETLQKGKGAAAQAGIQKGIDSIKAEIARLSGGK